MMLILVCGLPGSGKTYFSNELTKHLGAWHISSDLLRKELDLAGRYDAESKQRVYDELLMRTKKALIQHSFVIIDSTFYQQKTRKLFQEIAKNLNSPIRIIELRAGLSTIKKRVSKKRADSEADFQVYLQLKDQFDPILQSHLTLWSDQLSLIEMIDQANEYIQLKDEY